MRLALAATANVCSSSKGPLDNPVWHALIGPHARFAIGIGQARHYPRENGGRLIAMAGERIRLPGYVELSAIATHPDARGRGLAGLLTYCLASRALGRGKTPFLHVRPENAPALSVYSRLDFEIRREIWVLWRKPVSVAAP
jgi:predicted GNAT family acetyltransferase